MSTFTLGPAANPNQNIQGTLSSQYTNWVQDQVKSAADAIAYHWYDAGGSLDTAIAIRDALSSGKFSVDDLFNVANGKSSFGGDVSGDPHPKLVVAGQTIDLSDFFGHTTQIEEWTSGNAKNTQYHAREYLTDFDAGNAPSGWDHPPAENHQPTATAIHVDVTETQSIYNDAHEITNLGPDEKIVNLINDAHATDVDGDVLHIVGGSVTLDDGNDLPSYIKVVGDTIVIDQNSRDLDYLLSGEGKEIKLTYQITDGHTAAITNTVTIDITGTADQYHEFGEGSVSATHYRSDSSTGGGNINGNVLSFDNPLPNDAFDFHFDGTLTAQQSGLTGNQNGGVKDSGAVDWISGAINLDATHPSGTADLASTALNDHQVDYNINFNGQADPTDSIKVTLDYHYDYWHMA